MEQSLHSQHAPHPLHQALKDFLEGRVALFNTFLSQVPPAQREAVLQQLIPLVEGLNDEFLIGKIFRRIGQHAAFSQFVPELASYWMQKVFFANLPNLKTRVAMSYADYPGNAAGEVDYDYSLLDQNGRKVVSNFATIAPGQTHTFEVAELLSGQKIPFGTFNLNSIEKNLGSMRIYAYWYNDNGMTTTHEKGAFPKPGTSLLFPTIVAGATLSTHLALGNRSAEKPFSAHCRIRNLAGQVHPKVLQISLAPNAALLVSLSEVLPDLPDFLAGSPGLLDMETDGTPGLYYYFIHNRNLDTWQIQHI